MLDSLVYHDVVIATVADVEAIDAMLADIPALAPVADADGNMQAVFRLDRIDSGFVATVPSAVSAAYVLDAVSTVVAAAAEAAGAAAEAATVTAARAAAAAAIQAALAKTDVWVLRAVEEGVPLTDPRKAYREQLRELLLQAATVADPATITIPAAPNWVPATT